MFGLLFRFFKIPSLKDKKLNHVNFWEIFRVLKKLEFYEVAKKKSSTRPFMCYFNLCKRRHKSQIFFPFQIQLLDPSIKIPVIGQFYNRNRNSAKNFFSKKQNYGMSRREWFIQKMVFVCWKGRIVNNIFSAKSPNNSPLMKNFEAKISVSNWLIFFSNPEKERMWSSIPCWNMSKISWSEIFDLKFYQTLFLQVFESSASSKKAFQKSLREKGQNFGYIWEFSYFRRTCQKRTLCVTKVFGKNLLRH